MQTQNAVIFNQPKATAQPSVNTQETNCCESISWTVVLRFILCLLLWPWAFPFLFVAWVLAQCVRLSLLSLNLTVWYKIIIDDNFFCRQNRLIIKRSSYAQGYAHIAQYVALFLLFSLESVEMLLLL